MPFPTHLLQTGPELNSHMAGSETTELGTQETQGRQNAQREREPSRNCELGGERQPSQITDRAQEAPTSHSHETRQEALTSTHANVSTMTLNQGTTQGPTRLRNVPGIPLSQPRRQKQMLKIASLNMNGNGSCNSDKWGAINNMMKVRKIAVLAIQESHPTEEMQQTLQRRFRNMLHVLHSADPDEPGAWNGISIALNKSLVKTADIQTQVLVEG